MILAVLYIYIYIYTIVLNYDCNLDKYCNNNQLLSRTKGTVPSEIGSLTKLFDLNLNDNNFRGFIYFIICYIINIKLYVETYVLIYKYI